MSEGDKDKPVTLADYIPPATKESRKAARDALSREDRERLEALERAVRETEPDAVARSKGKRRKKRRASRANAPRKSKVGANGLVVWAVLFMLLVAFFWD
ncbi:MAG: DUF3040 domain-containing protein [Litorimonas sp.]